MDYDVLLKNLRSFTEDEFTKSEPYLYAALRYGGWKVSGKNVGNQNRELPDSIIALITLGMWKNSGSSDYSIANFYSEYNSADLKTTAKFLKNGADKELAAVFASGIHNYKNPNNLRFRPAWITQSYAIEEWINGKGGNNKKLDGLRFELFTENTEIIETMIQSASTPFNEAVKRYASELDAVGSLKWEYSLYKCAAENGDAEAQYSLAGFYSKGSKKSHDYIVKAAEQGWAAAQHELGEYYYECKKFEDAVKWFSLADKQDYAQSSYMFGKMYLDGIGVKQDLQQGISLLERGAANGACEAYCLLARAYESGRGKEQDYKKAVEYYSVAALFGSEPARERLNVPEYLENEENIDKLVPLAQNGDVYAIYALSCFWDVQCDNDSRERDAKRAAEIWGKQADCGNAEAQYLLGLCYLEGTGVEEDAKKALDLFERAAKNGYVHALTEIGDMYKHGDGVRFSDKKGNEYYRRAAELGDTDAMHDLGRTYCEGYGVIADVKKGIKWLKKAADGGDTDSYVPLAYWLNELGDKESAREWRIKASVLGSRTAQYCLAENLLKGSKLEQRLKDEDVKEYMDYFFYFDKIFEVIKDKLPQ